MWNAGPTEVDLTALILYPEGWTLYDHTGETSIDLLDRFTIESPPTSAPWLQTENAQFL